MKPKKEGRKKEKKKSKSSEKMAAGKSESLLDFQVGPHRSEVLITVGTMLGLYNTLVYLVDHYTALLMTIAASIIAGALLFGSRKHDNIKTMDEYEPIFGHSRWVTKTLLARNLYTEAHKVFKKPIHINEAALSMSLPLSMNFIFLMRPEWIDYVWCHQTDKAQKTLLFNSRFEEMLGSGIFSSDGEQWKRQRSIASHIFTLHSLKDYMFRVFCDTSDCLLNKLDDLITINNNNNSNENGDVSVDVSDLFARLTLEAFTYVAFGVNTHCIEKFPEELPFPKAFDKAFALISLRFVDPFWKMQRWMNIFRERELKENVDIVDEFVYDVIHKRQLIKQVNKNNNNNNKNGCAKGTGVVNDSDNDENEFFEMDELTNTPRYDLLSLFVKDRHSRGETVTMKELRDVSVNFIIAGRDTTASLLTWTMYELCTSKQGSSIIKRIIDEWTLLSDDIDDFTYAKIKRMTYLDAVLLETLRLHPSVPILLRFALCDFELPELDDGNIGSKMIRKGDGIAIYLYHLGRKESLWGKDCELFKPERFLKLKKNINNNNNNTNSQGQWKDPLNVFPAQMYQVFNLKPRMCLGKHVALMESKIALLKILLRYDVFYDDNQGPMRFVWGPVLQLEDGLRIRFVPKA